RAHPGRGARRERSPRPVRRDLRRVLGAQPRRTGSAVARAAGLAAPGRSSRRARVLRARFGGGHCRVERGVLVDHHSRGFPVDRGQHALPPPVAQCLELRRRGPVPAATGRGRVHRCAQRDDDRVAARRGAHLPGGRPGTGGSVNPAVRVPRDPRAVRHLAPRGAAHADQLPRRPQVVVAGAGIAGLTAATALAERGVAVTVVEREEHLGGRVGAWTEQDANAGQLSVSRGFHAFFRQYYILRALLQRTDPELRRLRSVPDYPLLDAHGRRDTFRGLPRTPPWNALFFALRSPTFRLRDL